MMSARITSFNGGCEPHIVDKTLTAEQIEYLEDSARRTGQ